MGEKDGLIRLSNGCTYPYRYQDMEKLAKLMEKHVSLLNSADPDKVRMGFAMVNDEGKECSWHVKDKCLQVAEELSTLWNRMKVYAKSINVESLDEEEEDGGMDHKLHDQIVEYFKTGRIPYENYSSSKSTVKRNWMNKCSPYSLADDGLTLHKGRAVVLKKGEVMKAIAIYHHICGHSNVRQMRAYVGQLFDLSCVSTVSSYVASCSCGKMANINWKSLTVSVKNMSSGRRSIVISSGQESCDTLEISKKGLKTKLSYSFTETEYEKEFTRARSSSSSKFQVARDGKTLITSSGAIVLKDEEAINVCMRIHELCGHVTLAELHSFSSRFIFATAYSNLCAAVVKKCHFCRCKNNVGKILAQSPINVQNVSLDIKVHYDEGANERRFQIITHGVDPKVVENYVKTTIDTLKTYGRWKEPVFSPESALARSVLRVVDLLKGEEEEMDNVVDFDPIHNDILSDEVHVSDTVDEERGSESETGSVTESLMDICNLCKIVFANSKQYLIHRPCPGNNWMEFESDLFARWREEDAARLSMGRSLYSKMSSQEKGCARPQTDFIDDIGTKLKMSMPIGTEAGRVKSMDFLKSGDGKKIKESLEKHLSEAKGKLVCNECKVACKTHIHFIIHLTTFAHRFKVKETPAEMVSLLLGWYHVRLYLLKADPSELDENIEPDATSTLAMSSLRLTGN